MRLLLVRHGESVFNAQRKLAGQADGAVVATLGGTEMLVTATANKKPREGIDFFPLTVDFEERMYSVGRIPGSFFRREGRPSEQAILTCRLIDRPLRPSFRDGYRNETHIVVTSLSVDQENPFDVIFLDVNMPDMNGLETFKKLNKVAPDSSVVMITGYGKTLKELVEEARELGVHSVIDKPFKISQITEAIHDLIPHAD